MQIRFTLPDHIWLEIFKKLPFPSQAISRQVCRHWNFLITSVRHGQAPVTIVVLQPSQESYANDQIVFPKIGYLDGENETHRWKTFFLSKKHALGFLSTFCTGTKLKIIFQGSVFDTFRDVLSLISRKWCFLQDFRIELFKATKLLTRLAEFPNYEALLAKITSLTVSSLDCEFSSNFLSDFSQLEALCLYQSHLVVTGIIINKLPKNLKRFWCPGAAFKNTLPLFLSRFGSQLKAFSAKRLTQEDVELVSEKSSKNLSALRLESVSFSDPECFANSLAKFENLIHCGISGKTNVSASEMQYEKIFRSWSNIQSLSLRFNSSHSPHLIELAKGYCLEIEEMHLFDTNEKGCEEGILDLSKGLTSFGLTLHTYDTFSSIHQILLELSEVCDESEPALHIEISIPNATDSYVSLVDRIFGTNNLMGYKPDKKYFITWNCQRKQEFNLLRRVLILCNADQHFRVQRQYE